MSFYKLKEYRLQIKYFFQRLFRGYDDCAVWDLDYYICEKMIMPLRHLAKRHCSCPADLTPEEWTKILNEIIWAIEIVLADDFFDKMADDRKELLARVTRQQKAFELFGKYFLCLWD